MNKRIKNNQIIYGVIISILVIAIIFVLYLLLKKEEAPIISLIGNDVEIMYVNSEYTELGYNVLNEDGSTYNGEVKILSNLNTKQVGVYEITYNVMSKGKIISSTKRIVKVIDDPLSKVSLTLNGESIVYLLKGGTYNELGAKAFNNNVDITNSIITSGTVDTQNNGEYKIIYKVIIDNKEKKIERTVKVIDIQTIHSIDNKNKVISLNIYSEDFDYVILPNNEKSTSNKISYPVEKNGTYQFIIYAKGGLSKKYEVVVSNIEIIKPSGSCQAILDGQNTEIKIVNNKNVSKYQINGIDFYTTNYKFNYEIPNPVVRFYGQDGTYIDVTCGIKRIFNNNMDNITLSNTLTPCNNNWTTYNNELSKLMNEAGLKTREAVAIAADYLTRFDYKVAYSCGGKSLSFGINPKWGCETSVTKDVCTKSTGNMKCIYGMDCTGFTAWAFFQAGFSKDILRTSSQSTGMWGNFNASKHKYSFSGNQHLISQIKPGDIVWTEGHVGIVLGTSNDYGRVRS